MILLIKNIDPHEIPLILENKTDLTIYIVSACVVYM